MEPFDRAQRTPPAYLQPLDYSGRSFKKAVAIVCVFTISAAILGAVGTLASVNMNAKVPSIAGLTGRVGKAVMGIGFGGSMALGIVTWIFTKKLQSPLILDRYHRMKHLAEEDETQIENKLYDIETALNNLLKDNSAENYYLITADEIHEDVELDEEDKKLIPPDTEPKTDEELYEEAVAKLPNVIKFQLLLREHQILKRREDQLEAETKI